MTLLHRFSLLLLLMSGHICFAQTNTDFKAFLDTMSLQHRFNGAVLVVKDGAVLVKQGYGKADYRTGQSIQYNTLFNLGEASQEFTAVAVLQQVDAGKISLDASITTYLPELSYSEITVRHLLSHASGLPAYESLFAIHNAPGQRGTNADLITILTKRAPNTRFQPGRYAEYSSTNYALLAVILERVLQKSFADLLSENVLKPAGMKDAVVWAPADYESLPNRAYGFRPYIIKPAEIDFADQNDKVVGDKNLLVSLNDLEAWDSALRSNTLLSKPRFEEATAPALLADGSRGMYGLGFRVTEDAKDQTGYLEQEANFSSYRTYFRREKHGRFSVYVLSNARFSGIFNLGDVLVQAVEKGSFQVPPIPVSYLVAYTLLNIDIDAAVGAYKTAKKNTPGRYVFRESELNTLGYELLDLARVNDAIAVFELNMQQYPRSFNVYDSLAEAYARKGDTQAAIKYYQLSLAIYPSNENAKQMLRKLTGE